MALGSRHAMSTDGSNPTQPPGNKVELSSAAHGVRYIEPVTERQTHGANGNLGRQLARLVPSIFTQIERSVRAHKDA